MKKLFTNGTRVHNVCNILKKTLYFICDTVGDLVCRPRVVVGIATSIVIIDSYLMSQDITKDTDIYNVKVNGVINDTFITPNINKQSLYRTLDLSILPTNIKSPDYYVNDFINITDWTGSADKRLAFINLNPVMAESLYKLSNEFYKTFNKKLRVKSLWRSEAEQLMLIAQRDKLGYQVGGANSSSHRFGFAADISSDDIKLMLESKMLFKYNLYQPIELTGEYWHIESTYNISRYDDVYFNMLEGLAKEGYNGVGMYNYIINNNIATPKHLVISVKEFTDDYKNKGGNNEISDFILKSFYVESAFGKYQLSKTGAVGSWQFTKRTAASVKLTNRLSLKDSLNASIKLAEDNVKGFPKLKSHHVMMLHNLGKPSFINMIKFIQNREQLKDSTRKSIIVNTPGGENIHDDMTLVKAYTKYILTQWANASIAVDLATSVNPGAAIN